MTINAAKHPLNVKNGQPYPSRSSGKCVLSGHSTYHTHGQWKTVMVPYLDLCREHSTPFGHMGPLSSVASDPPQCAGVVEIREVPSPYLS